MSRLPRCCSGAGSSDSPLSQEAHGTIEGEASELRLVGTGYRRSSNPFIGTTQFGKCSRRKLVRLSSTQLFFDLNSAALPAHHLRRQINDSLRSGFLGHAASMN